MQVGTQHGLASRCEKAQRERRRSDVRIVTTGTDGRGSRWALQAMPNTLSPARAGAFWDFFRTIQASSPLFQEWVPPFTAFQTEAPQRHERPYSPAGLPGRIAEHHQSEQDDRTRGPEGRLNCPHPKYRLRGGTVK